MKIIKIRALNINSLKGKIEIDFEEFLKGSSIFAITGETGSGKTTILDVISCALYGKTPRLSNARELMSRGTGESFCEVEFEVNSKIYRSSWSIKRARKKADGNFQSPKMELALVDGKIIESQIKRVPKKIEEITGLDFERFTKSMMLAQGGFDAFLKAKESEKSAILEKITGTKIYSQISQKVYENFSILKKDIEKKEAILGNIEILEEEEKEKIENNLKEYLGKETNLKKEIKKLYEIVKYYSDLEKLEKEYQKSLEEFDKITKLKNENSFKFEKLEKVKKAIEIEKFYSEKNSIQQRILEKEKVLNRKDIKNLEQELESLDNKLKKISVEYENIDKKLKKEIEFDLRDEEKTLLSLKKYYEEHKKFIEELENSREIKNNLIKEIEIVAPKKDELENRIEDKQKIIDMLRDKREKELLIKKYEDDRKRLVKNEPCFLCGSIHHPFLENIEIDLNETDKELKSREKSLKTDKKELSKLNDKIIGLNSDLKNSEKNSKEIENKIVILENKLKNCSEKGVDKRLKEIENELKEISLLRVEKDRLSKEKELLFKEIENKKRLKELKVEIESLKDEFKIADNRFQKTISEKGFESEDDYKKYLLSSKERRGLEDFCNNLENNYRNSKILKESVENRLKEHKKDNLDIQDIDKLKIDLDNYEKELSEIEQNIGKLKEQLESDKNQHNKFEEQLKEIDSLKEDFKILSKLNDLIGSSDGNKFSKFAQGITLDNLIYLANEHLKILNERYYLIRKKDEVLSFEIVDIYQGDEKRGIETLSGGERFLVSLSLALGLSEMASQNISIDSLFLDEGFGTLDKNSLETALDALNRLEAKGKIIGIISHVETLKEYVPLQIRVKKVGGGVSEIEMIG